MKRPVLIAALLLAGCNNGDDASKAEGKAPSAQAKGAALPIPPYQMRAELGGGNRLAASANGEALFSNRCGSCHLAGGMGTNLLIKQRLAIGEPPENGLLANRKDLTADYVLQVVRQGKMAMPRLSRAEVTDSELKAIASYLEKEKK
jgi:mono/diheme cytochrome c family protein